MRSRAVFDLPVQNGNHSMKYCRNIALGEALSLQMVEFMKSLEWNIEQLISVPLSSKRLKERGYNQVTLVAQPLPYYSDIFYLPKALWKAKETGSQAGLDVNQRRVNVQNAYQADARGVKQKTVLLMDDVTTTGSTISSCTDALFQPGRGSCMQSP
jgi:competence protein ComFC